MTTDRIIEVGLAVLSGLIGFMTYRFATKALDQQEKTGQTAVDAGAYERAREIYESALDTIRQELESTRRDLNETRQLVHGLRDDNRELHNELTAVRSALASLQRSTGQN